MNCCELLLPSPLFIKVFEGEAQTRQARDIQLVTLLTDPQLLTELSRCDTAQVKSGEQLCSLPLHARFFFSFSRLFTFLIYKTTSADFPPRNKTDSLHSACGDEIFKGFWKSQDARSTKGSSDSYLMCVNAIKCALAAIFTSQHLMDCILHFSNWQGYRFLFWGTDTSKAMKYGLSQPSTVSSPTQQVREAHREFNANSWVGSRLRVYVGTVDESRWVYWYQVKATC